MKVQVSNGLTVLTNRAFALVPQYMYLELESVFIDIHTLVTVCKLYIWQIPLLKNIFDLKQKLVLFRRVNITIIMKIPKNWTKTEVNKNS